MEFLLFILVLVAAALYLFLNVWLGLRLMRWLRGRR